MGSNRILAAAIIYDHFSRTDIQSAAGRDAQVIKGKHGSAASHGGHRGAIGDIQRIGNRFSWPKATLELAEKSHYIGIFHTARSGLSDRKSCRNSMVTALVRLSVDPLATFSVVLLAKIVGN